jgi:RimK family alpha-L-glutamate ligase
MALIAVIGYPQEANEKLVAAWRARGFDAALLAPQRSLGVLGRGDVAIGRLDVLPTLDGIEPGLTVLGRLAEAGVRVLNDERALVAAHDKLRSAALLHEAGLPQPKTAWVVGENEPPLEPPFVVKPRFGSWGRDVFRCATPTEARIVLGDIRSRRWYDRHGALVQELLPLSPQDLRLLVAGGRVVGAACRTRAPGEWRTNVSLGGTSAPVEPSGEACRLGVAAVTAIGADIAGVDLLPVAGGYVVLELNGAIEFDEHYGLAGRDVYLDLAEALDLVPRAAAA